jgi:Di-haem oxidoreductase, putative peroxidase
MRPIRTALCLIMLAGLTVSKVQAQLTDRIQAPNAEGAGIAKSLDQEIGAGVGNLTTPESSTFIIARDPARSIRRGRQLFQRKFTTRQGLGPRAGDGIGDISSNAAIGAGLVDSCAGCHGRPRGSAGSGGDVQTRPDSRDAPHLFGLGLKEMLADEMTAELRATRDQAVSEARRLGTTVTRALQAKGIAFGSVSAAPDGRVFTADVRGVDPDLRVRPFFAHGGTTSIREFVVGALNDEMGLQAVDPLLSRAAVGQRVVTPSGMVLDGSRDRVKAPPAQSAFDDLDGDGVRNEFPTSLVDHLEFYLLNYFKPAIYRETTLSQMGLNAMRQVGCLNCHVQNLRIERDRRVADVETTYDPSHAVFNGLFSSARLLVSEYDDGSRFATIKRANLQGFLVRNFFSDLKRHDLGPLFHERNFDGTLTTMMMTTPLWGAGTTAPYGHDGRSINLREVILRHGGEAARSRNQFAELPDVAKLAVTEYLSSLVLFPPDDTASNLDPGDPTVPGYPQRGHGSIRLSVLFNDSLEGE